jgi:hypothetical protein
MKRLLLASAVIELGAGLLLLIWSAGTVGLLFGAALVLRGSWLLRLVGGGLLALGAANGLASRRERSRTAMGVVGFMTLYNLAWAVALAAVRIARPPGGVLLWPAAVLHAAMTVWCALALRTARRSG